jgi:hypothetical protein
MLHRANANDGAAFIDTIEDKAEKTKDENVYPNTIITI